VDNRGWGAPIAERKGRSDRGRSASREGAQNPRSGRLRCAIYTRKSLEKGFEQEINSLDAQREACEAYVRSQRHEGWLASPALYDDPGYSCDNMERPALKRLLAVIAAKKIDVVVVYKVDRLTRSLANTTSSAQAPVTGRSSPICSPACCSTPRAKR
jgi:hypothetical protein